MQLCVHNKSSANKGYKTNICQALFVYLLTTELEWVSIKIKVTQPQRLMHRLRRYKFRQLLAWRYFA